MVKKILRFLGILLVIVILCCCILGYKNTREMNQLVEDGVEAVSQHFTLTQKDPGQFAKIKTKGILPFVTKQYEIEGLGNLSVMTFNVGLMQMVAFNVVPFERDMPLLCVDYMYMLTTRKGILEFYDLTEDKEGEAYQAILEKIAEVQNEYSDLEDSEANPGWYDELLTLLTVKKASISQDERYHSLFVDSVEKVAALAADCPPLDEEKAEAKRALIAGFGENLLKQGGFSTDTFKDSLGEEATREFFEKVFYGYGN